MVGRCGDADARPRLSLRFSSLASLVPSTIRAPDVLKSSTSESRQAVALYVPSFPSSCFQRPRWGTKQTSTRRWIAFVLQAARQALWYRCLFIRRYPPPLTTTPIIVRSLALTLRSRSRPRCVSFSRSLSLCLRGALLPRWPRASTITQTANRPDARKSLPGRQGFRFGNADGFSNHPLPTVAGPSPSQHSPCKSVSHPYCPSSRRCLREAKRQEEDQAGCKRSQVSSALGVLHGLPSNGRGATSCALETCRTCAGVVGKRRARPGS